jgi:hypothetical protein
MLIIDGQLPEAAEAEALEHYAFKRLYAAIRQETLPEAVAARFRI